MQDFVLPLPQCGGASFKYSSRSSDEGDGPEGRFSTEFCFAAFITAAH